MPLGTDELPYNAMIQPARYAPLFCRTLAVLAGLTLPGLLLSRTSIAAEPSYRTAADLERALQQPVTIVQEGSEVRAVLRELSTAQQVACWLDRRVDPSQAVSLQLQQRPLREVFDAVAAEVDCICCRVGDSLVIGRPEELDVWLTQAEDLSNRLKLDRAIPATRRLQLSRGSTVVWQDLDEPSELLRLLAKRWELTITNPEQMPHDLWAGGTLAGVDAIEALSFVLGQFELSLEWDAGARSIILVPMPSAVTVERVHRPKGASLETGIARIKDRFPHIDAVTRGTSLVVRATVLQHEAIAIELGETVAARQPATRKSAPAQREFSKVQIVRKSAADVLQALMAQGLEIDYDAPALTAAGVDLSQRITLEFETISAENLIAAICEPVGLEYEIVGSRYRLRPKAKP